MTTTLRPVSKKDAPLLLEWVNNRETRLHSDAYRPVSLDSHEQWLERVVTSGPNGVHFAFMIVDSQLPDPVGLCQLVNIDWISRTAEVRIRIGVEGQRGKGHGTSALQQLIRHAFIDLNLRRLELTVFADNARARSLYKAAGFFEEGYSVGARFLNGRYCDLIHMALLRQDSALSQVPTQDT